MADIDVIIPLHNKASFVEQAIRSALDQTLLPRSVIVSDDGSTDDGPERVEAMQRQHPEIVLLRSPTRVASGAAAARNRAIARSDAEFVAFLDADDWWEKTKLERQIDLFADTRVGLVHCGCNYRSMTGELLFVLPPDPLPPPEDLYDSVRLGTYWVTGSASAVVVRRSVWNKTDGFPQRAIGEDWRAWVSCAQYAGFAAVPEPLTNYRYVPRAVSRTDAFLQWLESMREWEDEPRFMTLAADRARVMAVGPQLDALRSRKATDALAARIATDGGALGDLFPTRLSYYLNLTQAPKRGAELLLSRIRRRIARLAISRGSPASDR
jgi:glycosyltransferase involved in cell wall biosynthesis